MLNLITEREGIEPRPQKRLDSFLGELGSVAFAIAPLYPTFLHEEDGVSCHLACLLMLHCLLSWRVVNGSIQLPQDRLWFLCDFAQAALHYRNSSHAPPIETAQLGLGADACYALLFTQPFVVLFLQRHMPHHVP